MTNTDLFLQLAIETARAAGQVIRRGAMVGEFHTRQKGVRNVLTDVDLVAERTIVQAIQHAYPDHDILTEETPAGGRRSRYQWVIDPLDGTSNFVHRYPCFSTSIALTCDDEPVVGVVYDPIHEVLFAGARGLGATLNGHPLQVSQIDAFIQTQIGMDWSYNEALRAQTLSVMSKMAAHGGTIRCCGSAALGICYVAAGWWDAYFHLGLSAWDAAAAVLIVREAGGTVTNLTGQDWRMGEEACLASNGTLHAQFCEYVRIGSQ
ncbi:MAG: inositol monophosphatase [Anaerolineae bacterium]|nr:inositol monophosphatase [Anaerolineae bacterium]